jgi:hypothetical protein
LGNSVIFQVSARQFSIFFTETQGKSSDIKISGADIQTELS